MKITPTPPSLVEGEGIMMPHPDVSTVKRNGYFHIKNSSPERGTTSDEMPHVIEAQ